MQKQCNCWQSWYKSTFAGIIQIYFRRKIPSLHKSHKEYHQVSVSGGRFDRESYWSSRRTLINTKNSRSTLHKHKIRHMVQVSAYLHEVDHILGCNEIENSFSVCCPGLSLWEYKGTRALALISALYLEAQICYQLLSCERINSHRRASAFENTDVCTW